MSSDSTIRIQTLGVLRRSSRRQVIFFTTVALVTVLATWVFADILWRGGLKGIEICLLVLFVPLFGMVTLGFTQAVFGFFILLRRRDPYGLSRLLPDAMPAAESLPPTAIAVPIFNEDVSRVYEGIRAIYLDLARAGYGDRFDIFILSDSNDPNKWIEEEVAWIDLCKQLKGFGRIFYRKRKVALNRKSGNISDFLRRWGRKYRYMVVLDADSLMEGRTLARMVQLMELNPQAGIIQTAPAPIQGETFFARMMQFSGLLYGPVFQAGLNYWQASSGNFWGHNAIIRTAPFIEHCALPTVTESGREGRTRFMSHDYVEAALMRRAKYEVWLAYELGGSYENLPPTLVDHARRDRRWCRGNLQHSWLLTSKGFHPINRLHLFLGVLSYLSSPLWFLFLILGTIQCRLYWASGAIPRYDDDVGLSSFLDIGGARLAMLLFLVTVVMLTLPKVLAVVHACLKRERRMQFGGGPRLALSAAFEHVLSALQAPIQMCFNTRFVIEILSGREVPWGTQRREAGGVDWGGIVNAHAMQTAVGVVWAMIALHVNSVFFWWLSPVTFGLMASIPLSAALSLPQLGAWLARRRWFMVPSETWPPPVVVHLEKHLASIHKRLTPPEWLQPHSGLAQVILDPYISAAHCSLLRQGRRSRPVNRYLADLQARLLAKGPADLNRREQVALLLNAQAVAELHERVWRLPEAQLASWWKLAMRHYNSLTDQPQTALYR